MNTPTLFDTNEEVTLSSAQVVELEKILRLCPTYSVVFGIHKNKAGLIEYVSCIWFTDRRRRPDSKTIIKTSFGEMVAEMTETIHKLKL